MATPGVVYISSLPPSMVVQKLRSLLCKFGVIKRVFMRKEDARQVCWVEFADKRVAKEVALNCNGMTMESTLQGVTARKKLRCVSGDIWCIRYLSKFTWNNLEEHLRGKKQARSGLVAIEARKVEQETDFLLKNIDMERKRRKRGHGETETVNDWTHTQKTVKGGVAVSSSIISQL